MPEAMKLAHEIAAHPVSTLLAVKRLLFENLFAKDVGEVMDLSDDTFAVAAATPERFEAMVTAREKRAPNFHDPEHMERTRAAMMRLREGAAPVARP
jgi:enoyl-CoA hydratase/carnithine racemase